MNAASENCRNAVERLENRANDAMRRWHSRSGLNARNANQNALKDVLVHTVSSVPVLGIPVSVLNGMRSASADGAVQAMHHEAISAARRLHSEIRRTDEKEEGFFNDRDPEIRKMYANLDKKIKALGRLVNALEKAAASRRRAGPGRSLSGNLRRSHSGGRRRLFVQPPDDLLGGPLVLLRGLQSGLSGSGQPTECFDGLLKP